MSLSRPGEAASWLQSLERFGVRLGLHRIETLLDRLGNPHRGFESVHVAGTNGKGSVAAMIAAALGASGLRTGLYTSPHLVRLGERVAIDGTAITEEALAALLLDVRDAAAGLEEPVTYFEATTAAAFLHFRREGVPWVVAEVGLGGRLDATNVLQPRLGVITSLGFDHVEVLGPTAGDIAREKAGILKPGVQAVASESPPEFLDPLRIAARERGADLRMATECVEISPRGGGLVDFRTARRTYAGVRLALAGGHQVDNARTAVAALEMLEEGGLALGATAVRAGLERVRWPGRLEVVGREPLLVLDGAHNVDGCRALARWIASLPGPPVVVFAALADKDLDGMAGVLFPAADHVVLTELGSARAAPVTLLRPLAWRWARSFEEEPGPLDALERAREKAGRDGTVIACGSLYLVGAILAALRTERDAEVP